MYLKLTGFDFSENVFSFSFEYTEDDKQKKVSISFENDWEIEFGWSEPWEEITEEYIDQAVDLLSGVIVFAEKAPLKPNYAEVLFEEMMDVMTIGIPNPLTREILREVLILWARFRKCPLEVKTINHPQYPLLAIISNDHVIRTHDVKRVVSSILTSIAHGVFTENEVEEDESIDELFEDEADENEIIEFELDPEVAALTDYDIHETDTESDTEMYQGIKEDATDD